MVDWEGLLCRGGCSAVRAAIYRLLKESRRLLGHAALGIGAKEDVVDEWVESGASGPGV